MSWEAYTDSLLGTGHVSHAAIVGLSDGAVWATSKGLTIQPEEIRTLIRALNDNGESVQACGFHLGSTKYMYIQSDSSQIQGKKGTTGVSIQKTHKTLLIGVYDDGIQPGNCRTAVGKLADYLKGADY